MEQQYDRITSRTLTLPIALPSALPLVALTLALFGVVILVQLRGVTTTGYDLRRLQNERADWRRENQLLESYVANLQSLDRVERVAVDKLKMMPTKDRVFLKTERQPAVVPVAAELPPASELEATTSISETPERQFARWLASWLAAKPPGRAQ